MSDLEFFIRCVGKGWAEPVERCLKVLSAAGAHVEQVKQKFATLRVYYFLDTKDLWTYVACEMAVKQADKECRKRCEECGAPGRQIRPRWWVSVSCDECAKEKSDVSA